MREDGFTLMEVLVSLIILSALAVVMSRLTQSYLQSFERSERSILEARVLLAEIARIDQAEQGDESNPDAHLKLVDSYGTGGVLVIAVPHIDKRPDCIFDQIGRRCR